MIQDDEKVSLNDLGSNLFVSESDINVKTRAEACLKKLKKINKTADVIINSGPIQLEFLNTFNLVIVADFYSDFEKLYEINKYCRSQKKPIGFIYTGCYGLFGFIFTDFSDIFKIYDKDGENSLWYAVENISRARPGVVTINSNRAHKFETGDFVIFSDIEGMIELNAPEPRPIKVISPYSFTIEDTTYFQEYIGGGRVERIKVPSIISFNNLEESLTNFTEEQITPEWEKLNLVSYNRHCNLKLALYSLSFYAKVMGEGSIPFAYEESKIKNLVESARNLMDEIQMTEKFDEYTVKNVIKYANYQIAPLCAFFGGFVALETIKYCGKFNPVKGFLFYDILSSLPDEIDTQLLLNWQTRPKKTRYDDQIIIFGQTIQNQLENLR